MTDPRFDPAFQRGYSGPDPELVVREAPVIPDEGPDVAAPARAAEAPRHPDPEPERQTESRFAIHNPARFALLLLGIALLIVAVGSLYWEVLHPQATSTTVESQFVEVLVSNLPPVLGLAGFGCVILWLALGALDRVNVAAPEESPSDD